MSPMIPYFLRLFSTFRALEQDRDTTVAELRATVREFSNDKLLLQDRLDATLSDRQRMWDLMERSIEDMKLGYQAHLNVQWVKQGYSAPYPDAPQPPEHHVHQQVTRAAVGRPRLGSEMVKGLTEKFIQGFMDEVQ